MLIYASKPPIFRLNVWSGHPSASLHVRMWAFVGWVVGWGGGLEPLSANCKTSMIKLASKWVYVISGLWKVLVNIP